MGANRILAVRFQALLQPPKFPWGATKGRAQGLVSDVFETPILQKPIYRLFYFPSDHQQNMGLFIEDEWIYRRHPRRRLAWVPMEYREGYSFSVGNRIVLKSFVRGPLILTFDDSA